MRKIIKNQQIKKFSWIILTMVCMSLLRQTALRAQFSNPTLPAGVGANSGVNTAQGNVEVVVVDSSDPSNTKVWYRLTTGSITTATFYAPGIPQGITRQSISAGNFYFTFNLRNVDLGEQNITLNYNTSGSSEQHHCTFTTTGTNLAPFGIKHAGTWTYRDIGGKPTTVYMYVTHKVTEHYKVITFEKPISKSSKTVKIGLVQAQLIGDHSYDLPQPLGSGYAPSHSYVNAEGQHHSDVLDEATFPENAAFKVQRAKQYDDFLSNRGILTGKTVGTFLYDGPNGHNIDNALSEIVRINLPLSAR